MLCENPVSDTLAPFFNALAVFMGLVPVVVLFVGVR